MNRFLRIKSLARFLLLSLSFLLGSSPAHAERRTWNDSTGNFAIEAELVRKEGDNVILKLDDGSTRTVPLERLSQSDLEYLEQRELEMAEREKDGGAPTGDNSSPSPSPDSPPPPETPDTSADSILEAFYHGAFSEEGISDERFLGLIRMAASAIPDSKKPEWGFPAALIGGVVFAVIGGFWFLVNTFRD